MVIKTRDDCNDRQKNQYHKNKTEIKNHWFSQDLKYYSVHKSYAKTLDIQYVELYHNNILISSILIASQLQTLVSYNVATNKSWLFKVPNSSLALNSV